MMTLVLSAQGLSAKHGDLAEDAWRPNVGNDCIRLYQRYLSKARGSRCAMYPSCSNYGLTAFSKKPFAIAIAMTADRMIRCGHDGGYYPITYEYGYSSLVDLPPFDSLPPHLVYWPRSYVVAGARQCRNANDSVIGFVHHLIDAHDYQLALLEIERIEYFKPHLRSPELRLLRLLCYDGLDREEEGLLYFHSTQSQGGKSDGRLLFRAAKMYGELGNHREAVNVLSAVNSSDRDTLFRKYVCMSLASLRAGDERAACDFIGKSAGFAPDASVANFNSRQMLTLGREKKKSPLAAGLLSIVPGGGYVYDRQPASALTALIVNGLLAYATATSIKSNNYGVAAVMGVFSLTFYTGNILGAVSGAKRYNKRRVDACATSIERANNIYW